MLGCARKVPLDSDWDWDCGGGHNAAHGERPLRDDAQHLELPEADVPPRHADELPPERLS